MRIFLAGATGVSGLQLLPLLVDAGHVVAGTSFSAKVAQLAALGAKPVVCDVIDADALAQAVVSLGPDAVVDQPRGTTPFSMPSRVSRSDLSSSD